MTNHTSNAQRRVLHVGLDDTDSSDGMCTTFLTFNLLKKLISDPETKLIDYPNLIRLNPNIPWKTRGNASLVLRLETNRSSSQVFQVCKRFLLKFATSPRANGGLVLFEGEKIPSQVRQFSRDALTHVQRLSEAKRIMNEEQIEYFGLRNQQGLVGALAGIGNELEEDYTFELIAYRRNCSLKRTLSKDRVIAMDQKTKPSTFSSYDPKNDRILIMPHGHDPVLFGIRGETPRTVKRAYQMLLPVKNLLGYMIVRSNQGTGEHLRHELDLSCVKAYSSGKVRGIVSSPPRIERGGHVFFDITNQQGSISCAAYEPTGKFRIDALSLATCDEVEVAGGIRKNSSIHPKVLNLEYFIPCKLTTMWVKKNPLCPRCDISMSSEGQNKGFQCKRCGLKTNTAKSREKIQRSLIENRLYLPDLKAHRHLTKPFQRYAAKTGRGMKSIRIVKEPFQVSALVGKKKCRN